MEYSIRLAIDDDAGRIAEIFNHFILNTFAAYPSTPVDESVFAGLKGLAGGLPVYVIETSNGTVVGFAGLRPLHFADTMNRSAEVTIFILPEHTRHGMGGKTLARMEEDAKALGVDTIIGGVSSHNQPRIDFQRKHGFVECGTFRRVGRKFNQDFDILWMQKYI
jgi:L-amino acid N-acyltransferase YncA